MAETPAQAGVFILLAWAVANSLFATDSSTPDLHVQRGNTAQGQIAPPLFVAEVTGVDLTVPVAREDLRLPESAAA
jgi:hypothetical protein